MVSLAQVIKGLRAARGRAHKEFAVWRKRLLRLESWAGIPEGKHKGMDGEKAEAEWRRAEENLASPESTLGRTEPAKDS